MSFLTILAAVVSGRESAGQAIPAPEYVTFLPRGDLIATSATEPSRRFALFGDGEAPGFQDVDPRNGIDDRRDRLFERLGVQFAPWMVRNAYGFPMDIGRLITERGVPLVADRFDLSAEAPRFVRSDTLLPATPGAPCGPAPSGDPDCRLLDWLRERGPQTRRPPPAVTSDSDPADVLYLDFPGDGPRTWAREYGGAGTRSVSPRYRGFAKAYLHPFIAPAPAGSAGEERFELVLQFWFFYPTNDAGNVHEGDWEHLNVLVGPRDRVTESLDEATVRAVLDGTLASDSLVIRRVEYYFHHWVFALDYTRPNVYRHRDQWRRERDSLPTVRTGEAEIWTAVRNRAYLDADERRINRHPLVFIGGDGRGLGLMLRPPGAAGLSSHGSYPFPGLYKAVGPAGTGESIHRPWLMHRQAPDSTADETEELIRFDRTDRIEIMPDWERLANLALEESPLRWRWAWFLLPLRSGYPATVSPFAGVVRYAETGNAAPVPPPYNSGWNRMSAAAGYSRFDPHRISGHFPLAVQDAFDARWGYLNGAKAVAMLPPFDALGGLILRPLSALAGLSPPTYARGRDLPARRMGIGVGVTRFQPATTFANLVGFPELSTPLIQRATQRAGEPFAFGLTEPRLDPVVSWRVELDLHLGDHFVTGNSVTHSRSRLDRDVVFNDNSIPAEPIRADLNFWHYAGSLRWNLRTSRVQPFLTLGYGLTWYRLEHLRGFDEDLGSSRWVRRPGLVNNLMPNTWLAGGGVEVLPRYGFGKLNLGIKATAEVRTHRLGLTTGDNTSVFFQDGRITSWVLSLLMTLAI